MAIDTSTAGLQPMASPNSPDLLSLINSLGTKTTTSSSSANTAPLTQAFNQGISGLSPADATALIQSIFATGAANVPTLQSALGAAVGTRTSGNSPLALSLNAQNNQLSTAAMQAILQNNQQGLATATSAASGIASATKNTSQVTTPAVNPLLAILLGTGINKLAGTGIDSITKLLGGGSKATPGVPVASGGVPIQQDPMLSPDGSIGSLTPLSSDASSSALAAAPADALAAAPAASSASAITDAGLTSSTPAISDALGAATGAAVADTTGAAIAAPAAADALGTAATSTAVDATAAAAGADTLGTSLGSAAIDAAPYLGAAYVAANNPGVQHVTQDITSGISNGLDSVGNAVGNVVDSVGNAVSSFFGGLADGGTTSPDTDEESEEGITNPPTGVPNLLSLHPFLHYADGGSMNPSGAAGLISGPGTGTSDSVSARSNTPGSPGIQLSNQEYIIPADVVQAMGRAHFDNLLAAFHTPVRR